MYKYGGFISYLRNNFKTADTVCSYFAQNKINYFHDCKGMVGGRNYLEKYKDVNFHEAAG